VKKISILVPESSVLAAIDDPRYMFTAVNDFLSASGKSPLFDVQLVGLSKEVKLHNSLFTVHPDKLLNEVKKTDLIFIPALSGDIKNFLEKNKAFIPWIIKQYKGGAEVASLCIGAFLLAATGLLNGMMTISNEDGSVSFSVEEYKRPKFEVKYEPITGIYRLNDKITVKGKAVAYSGAAVDNARVQYRVVRTASFPYWFYSWRGYPSSSAMEIVHGTAMTDDKGEFNITFNAIPDLSISKESKPVFNYSISSDVTDINGETQSESHSVSVSYQTLLLTINIPNELNRESAKDFTIGTHNMSGTFVPSSGNIVITKLKEPSRLLRKRKWAKTEKQQLTRDEYEKNFPYDVYADEDNPEKWENETSVYNSMFDTGKDSLLRLSTIGEWKQGTYKLEIVSRDKYNEEVRLVKFFVLFSGKEKQAATNSIDHFSVLKDNAEPGGIDQFLIGTHDRNVKVLYEVEQKNKIINKQWLTLNDEQRLIEIPIIETYRGNVAIHLTFVKHNRDYHFNHVLTVPFTNKELDISFETFRSKLTPGQKEEWRVKIKGKNGEKVASEMLASMYDASLDAFRPHSWMFDIYNSYYSTLDLTPYKSFSISNSNLFSLGWNVYQPQNFRTYDQLNWFGFNYYYGYRSGRGEPFEMYDAVSVNGSYSAGMGAAENTGSVPAQYGDKTTVNKQSLIKHRSRQRGGDDLENDV